MRGNAMVLGNPIAAIVVAVRSQPVVVVPPAMHEGFSMVCMETPAEREVA